MHLLYGESWVDKQHRVLALVGLRTGKERGKGALHGAADGHAALWRYVYINKSLDESRGLHLQFGQTLNVRIRVGYAVLQRLDLRVHTYLCGRQSWYAHLHLNIFHATLLFGGGSYLLHLADSGFGKVLNTHLGN